MNTKLEIAKDWLTRYTGMPLEKFGEYIILVNFDGYINSFSKKYNAAIYGQNYPMQACTSNNITVINFSMGSPMAATIMDLLTAINPKACLFLGKCGGLKDKTKVGDLILPIAGIRGEGTSNDYIPPEVPSLPAFAMQKAISTSIREAGYDYFTGTVYTTNRRLWEHDQDFKNYLVKVRAMAIDMETATIFTVGFANDIPTGALLLVSDQPMTPDGVKTSKSDTSVTINHSQKHLDIGVSALEQLIQNKQTIKHLIF